MKASQTLFTDIYIKSREDFFLYFFFLRYMLPLKRPPIMFTLYNKEKKKNNRCNLSLWELQSLSFGYYYSFTFVSLHIYPHNAHPCIHKIAGTHMNMRMHIDTLQYIYIYI